MNLKADNLPDLLVNKHRIPDTYCTPTGIWQGYHHRNQRHRHLSAGRPTCPPPKYPHVSYAYCSAELGGATNFSALNPCSSLNMGINEVKKLNVDYFAEFYAYP